MLSWVPERLVLGPTSFLVIIDLDDKVTIKVLKTANDIMV